MAFESLERENDATILVKNGPIYPLSHQDVIRFFPKGEDYKEYYLYTVIVCKNGSLFELQRQKTFATLMDWLESIPDSNSNRFLTKNMEPNLVHYWKCPHGKQFSEWTNKGHKFLRDTHNRLYEPTVATFYGIYYPEEGIYRIDSMPEFGKLYVNQLRLYE